MIITSASQKGGVTKSTFALALAALLAQRFVVSAVDLDREAYATTLGLGQDKATDPLNDAPVRVRLPGVRDGQFSLFAGGDAIDSADEAAVTAHIQRAARVSDVVLIDTPPNGASAAVTAAIRAANVILIPVVPEFQSLLGMQRLIATAQTLGSNALIRALLSRWEPRTVLAQDVHRQLVLTHPGLALSSVVPKDQRAAEAMAAACPVPLYSKRSPAAAAYRIAAYEIAAVAGLHVPKGAI